MTKIIVGVDGSERSQDAIAFALDLAHAADASMTLVCAYPYTPVPARVSGAQIREYLAADAEATLARLRADAEGAETRAIADPSPARALHMFAEGDQAALIVVGSSHHSKLGCALIGSTAMRLLHGAPCAVAVVPRGYAASGPHAIAKIGCAFDGSDESRAALAVAASAAERFDALLQVIRVHNLNDFPSPIMGYGPALAADGENLESAARDELQRAVDELPQGVRAEAAFVKGVAAVELTEQSEGLDVLFAGSRGYGPHRAVLLGSVIDELLT
jgi:nucleotide-binding universal stress UspA family protein